MALDHQVGADVGAPLVGIGLELVAGRVVADLHHQLPGVGLAQPRRAHSRRGGLFAHRHFGGVDQRGVTASVVPPPLPVVSGSTAVVEHSTGVPYTDGSGLNHQLSMPSELTVRLAPV
jgi:hypothetical protein